jgi:uncharacterized protein (TIGR02391 family)
MRGSRGYALVMENKVFRQEEIEAISAALGDTGDGLTGSEIGHILSVCRMADPAPEITKRHRIHNALAVDQNSRGNRTGVLAFMRHAMKPERHLGKTERYEAMRANLNRALAFVGLAFDAAGSLEPMDAVSTITEAERRADELRADLTRRGVHPEVLRFCRAELVADNYFHAVLEAMKSVAEKIRQRTGLTDDGNVLIDRALAGDPPLLAINPLATESHRSEQKGFANLVRGTFGMFRNVTAHEARILWTMNREDAEDLLSLASLIHRRLDAAHMPTRP